MILSDDILINEISCVQGGYGKESQSRFFFSRQVGCLGRAVRKKTSTKFSVLVQFNFLFSIQKQICVVNQKSML